MSPAACGARRFCASVYAISQQLLSFRTFQVKGQVAAQGIGRGEGFAAFAAVYGD
ncbi:hypothetical protein [Pseudomonas sp. MWU15-20650]|uniref:hypothetical protein n=1 Tax=Pseudomonas sp. MWU15-20650 TaxID=2933107 RepID=UPI00200C1768|nr:hypothetical protein [Pseudomonas sp. MWU15-20650]